MLFGHTLASFGIVTLCSQHDPAEPGRDTYVAVLHGRPIDLGRDDERPALVAKSRPRVSEQQVLQDLSRALSMEVDRLRWGLFDFGDWRGDVLHRNWEIVERRFLREGVGRQNEGEEGEGRRAQQPFWNVVLPKMLLVALGIRVE